MKTIKLSRREYEGSSYIFVDCEPDSLFDQMIVLFPGIRRTRNKKSWYIKDKESNYRELRSYFRDYFNIDSSNTLRPEPFLPRTVKVKKKTGSYGPVIMEVSNNGGKLGIQFLGRYNDEWISEIRQYGNPIYDKSTKTWYLRSNKLIIDSLSEYFTSLGIELEIKKKRIPEKIYTAREEISSEVKSRTLRNESKEAISKLESYLKEKRFSPNTISTYTSQLEFFLKYFHEKAPDNISMDEISSFIQEYVIGLGFSISYQNQLITTLKTTYSLTGNRLFDFEDLRRPRLGRSLPQVFSREEITRILNSPGNIKHKLILWMIYSCGLRRSEVINIKLGDLNFDRGTLHIRSGKGNVDRVVPIPESVKSKIEEYRSSYHPTKYLFEGQSGGRYSAGSVYRIFKTTLSRLGIVKDVGVHSLRHSYATHLHESGLDIRYIQELLGHKSSKTTEIYTHVSRRKLLDIRSPIDDLDLK